MMGIDLILHALLTGNVGNVSRMLSRTLTESHHLDWGTILWYIIRFALAGAAYATFNYLRSWLHDIILPSVYIHHDDPAFPWVVNYLAREPSIQDRLGSCRFSGIDDLDARMARVPARGHEFGRHGSSDIPNKGKGKSQAEVIAEGGIIGFRTPLNETWLRITFRGHWLWIRRSLKGFAGTGLRHTDHLRIISLGWNRTLVKQFLLHTHDLCHASITDRIFIHYAGGREIGWGSPVSRQNRPWDSVHLPKEIKDRLLKDVQGFLSREEKMWYADRGIPHRRGYLLHGLPGAGKTTLVTAIASHLKLDVFIVNPSSKYSDDNSLNALFRKIPPGSMILIEDMRVSLRSRYLRASLTSCISDCIMPSRHKDPEDDSEEVIRPMVSLPSEIAAQQNQGNSSGAGATTSKSSIKRKTTSTSTSTSSSVTMSGLLNAIDGVTSQEGCILFATTNHPEKLDEALRRPGRFDFAVEFGAATQEQVESMFRHFYRSASPTANSSEQTLGEPDVPARAVGPFSVEKVTDQGEGTTLETARLSELAEAFSSTLCGRDHVHFDDEPLSFSMASIQGFLLDHRRDPEGAVSSIGGWIQGTKDKYEVEKTAREAKQARTREKRRVEVERLRLEEEEAKARVKAKLRKIKKAPPEPVFPGEGEVLGSGAGSSSMVMSRRGRRLEAGLVLARGTRRDGEGGPKPMIDGHQEDRGHNPPAQAKPVQLPLSPVSMDGDSFVCTNCKGETSDPEGAAQGERQDLISGLQTPQSIKAASEPDDGRT